MKRNPKGRPAKTNRNKLIAVARYGYGMTQREIADAFAISEGRVSIVLSRRPECRRVRRAAAKESR